MKTGRMEHPTTSISDGNREIGTPLFLLKSDGNRENGTPKYMFNGNRNLKHLYFLHI